jgi:transposase-like protein
VKPSTRTAGTTAIAATDEGGRGLGEKQQRGRAPRVARPRKERRRRTVQSSQMSTDVLVGGHVKGHGAKTEAVRERAIMALLSGNSVSNAARRCGVNEKTLRRWMQTDESFKRELAEARRTMFQSDMIRMQALAGTAIDTLVALMDRRVPPAVRLGAARTVAELARHDREAEVISQRLDEIEAYQRDQARRQ